PVPGLCDLLQPRGDRVEALAELRPRELVGLALTRGRIVDVAVDDPVVRGVCPCGGDVAFDEVDQCGAIGDDDRPTGVVVLLELHVAPFRTEDRTSTSGNATVLPGDPTTGLIDPTACPRAHPNANRPGQPACRSVPPRAGSHHREKPHRGLDGSVVGDLRGLVDELRDVPECPL